MPKWHLRWTVGDVTVLEMSSLWADVARNGSFFTRHVRPCEQPHPPSHFCRLQATLVQVMEMGWLTIRFLSGCVENHILPIDNSDVRNSGKVPTSEIWPNGWNITFIGTFRERARNWRQKRVAKTKAAFFSSRFIIGLKFCYSDVTTKQFFQFISKPLLSLAKCYITAHYVYIHGIYLAIKIYARALRIAFSTEIGDFSKLVFVIL